MVPVTRPVRRESASLVFSAGEARPVIVSIEPPGKLLGFRLKGMKKTYTLSTEFCFREAMRQELLARQEARKKARKAAGR